MKSLALVCAAALLCLSPSHKAAPHAERAAKFTYLRVRGLKGFEQIDFEVAALAPDANARARATADRIHRKVRQRRAR